MSLRGAHGSTAATGFSPVVNIRSPSMAMPEVSASAASMKATPCAGERSMPSGRPFRLFRLLPVSWPIQTRQRQPFLPVPSMTLRIRLMRPFFPVCKGMPDKASSRTSSENFRNGLPATAGSWPVLPTGLWRGSIKKFGKPCIPALPTVRMNTRSRNFMRKCAACRITKPSGNGWRTISRPPIPSAGKFPARHPLPPLRMRAGPLTRLSTGCAPR